MFGVEVRHETDLDGRKVIIFGRTHGRQCRECDFFYGEQFTKVYNRCGKMPKKNWRAKLEACGMFQKRAEVDDE